MRRIVVTSGKGGVGKTTVTANLGRALSEAGKRVVLIDIDFGLNNLDVVMGLESKVVYDISDVLNGRCRLKQALVQAKGLGNLYILPSDSLSINCGLSGQNIKVIVENLSKIFDFVILDCPAGIDAGFHRAVSCADEAIVVTTPFLPSLRDADKVINILKSYKMDKIGIVVNRVRGDLILDKQMLKPTDISSILKTPVVGAIPEEDVVFLSDGGVPFKSGTGKAFKMLSSYVLGGKTKIYDTTSKYSGFFGSIRRSIKRNV